MQKTVRVLLIDDTSGAVEAFNYLFETYPKEEGYKFSLFSEMHFPDDERKPKGSPKQKKIMMDTIKDALEEVDIIIFDLELSLSDKKKIRNYRKNGGELSGLLCDEIVEELNLNAKGMPLVLYTSSAKELNALSYYALTGRPIDNFFPKEIDMDVLDFEKDWCPEFNSKKNCNGEKVFSECKVGECIYWRIVHLYSESEKRKPA